MNLKIPRLYKLFLLIIFVVFSKYTDAQHDADSLTNILLTQNLKDNFTPKEIPFNDSILDFFHIAEPLLKKDILSADLGNIGSASISEDFFKRNDFYKRTFLFNSSFNNYILNSENVIYYNTRRPYTSIMHTTSTKVRDLQTIDFIHTQNVNPNLNFGIQYNFISSAGQYLDQSNGLNSVGITSNYKKNKYSVFAAFVTDKFKLQNSGGYIDTLGFDQTVPEHFLLNSGTILSNKELSITQKYSLGKYKNLSYKDTIIKVLEPRVSFSHNIQLSARYFLYKDQEKSENTFYIQNYYLNNFSYDSVAVQSLINRFRFGSEEVFEKQHKFGFSFMLNDNLYKIYNFKNYITLQNTAVFFENQVTGNFYTLSNKGLNINISGNYYFTGYRTNDYRIKTAVFKNLFQNKYKSAVLLKFTYSNMKADYFQNTYYSNHFIWDNNFNSIQRADATFKYTMKHQKLNFRFNSAYIKNYIYNDISASPVQVDSGIKVFSAYVEKRFNLNRIIFENKVIWQHSSDDNIISLPQLAAYQSTYFIMHYKKALLVHAGYEVYYSTKYKSYSYNPSTGQFYFENNDKKYAGNYPYITVFANLKIKHNVLLFFKLMNVSSAVVKTGILPYYVNHYPLQTLMFKFGVKWTFRN
ncbi:MAG: putative porin [Bacteroidales bacterium]|nr:putative porin [Bacteroidales bacterium]